MLTPVVFLPLAAILINDVRTEVKDGALTVEIATSEAVAASDIRVATGGHHKLYVYLDDSVAKQSAFGEGAGAVVAHRRAHYTKLEVPTVERCGEPIGVVRTADGLRVRAACRDASSAKASGSAPARVAAGLDVERPLPDAPQAARARQSQSQSALRAALALPTESSADDTTPSPRPAGNSKPASEPGKAKAATVAQEEPQESPKVGLARRAEGEAPATAGPSQDRADGSIKGTETEKSSGSPLTTVLAVVLLVGVGIVTFVFARKRGSRERVIRIVETASIGPRRSLVVASVGGRTMVLGVSEAGVSLLDSPASLPAAVGMPKPTERMAEAALGLRNLGLAAAEPAPETPPEEKHESSLLGRLFRHKPREAEGLGRENFEQLFAESMEDEELRRKLALGQSGRIA